MVLVAARLLILKKVSVQYERFRCSLVLLFRSIVHSYTIKTTAAAVRTYVVFFSNNEQQQWRKTTTTAAVHVFLAGERLKTHLVRLSHVITYQVSWYTRLDHGINFVFIHG